MAELTAEEQAMMDKARNVTSKTIGMGGTADAPPETPITPTATQGVDEWGPYDKLTNVSTEYGVYGVPAGKILYFEETEWFSRRENRMVRTMKRKYRDPEPATA